MDRRRPRRDTESPRLAFVGAGRAAIAIATELVSAGWAVTAIASRNPESASALAERIPGAVAVPIPDVTDHADVIILSVPDGAIAEAASQVRWREGTFAVHNAGSRDRSELTAAESAGAQTGIWHPMVSMATDTPSLAGCAFGIDAGPELTTILQSMSDSIGCFTFPIPPNRPLYHAAAIMCSNFAIGLAAVAGSIWQELGTDRATAARIMAPLMLSAATNLREIGLPGALTGPVVRGDLATVEGHVAALNAVRPDLLPLYARMTEQIVPLALERGLDEQRAEAILSFIGLTGTVGSHGGS